MHKVEYFRVDIEWVDNFWINLRYLLNCDTMIGTPTYKGIVSDFISDLNAFMTDDKVCEMRSSKAAVYLTKRE